MSKKITKKTASKKKKLSLRQQSRIAEANKKQFDDTKTAADCVKDLQRVQTKFSEQVITRDFYRRHGNLHETTWTAHFGSYVQFQRAAGILADSRSSRKLLGKIAKEVSLDVFRKFYVEEIQPYHGKYKKKGNSKKRIKVLVIGSDFHDTMSDPFILAIFIRTCQIIQPDVIVLNGDIYECYEFSRYPQDIRRYKILERFEFVRDYIYAPLRKACPNAQIDFIIGNHDIRVLKDFADKPKQRILTSDWLNIQLKDIFGLDDHKINLITKLDMEAFAADDSKGASRKNYEVYYNQFVCCHEWNKRFNAMDGNNGHHHSNKLDCKTIVKDNDDVKKLSWTQSGSISRTHADYFEQPSPYNNGIVIAHIDTLSQSTIQESIMMQDDWASVCGHYYFRSDFEDNGGKLSAE